MKKKFDVYKGGFNRSTYEPYIVFRTTRKSLVYTADQCHKDHYNNKRRPWVYLYKYQIFNGY